MQEIKQRTLRENALLNGIRVSLNLLFPLIIFQHISRILGPGKLGQVEYVNSIVSYFIYFSLLGIPAYGLREIARCRNDLLERSKVVFELSIIPFILTCVSYVVYFFLVNYFEPLKRERLLCLVFAPNIFLSVFSFEWFYQGIEEQRYITLRYVIVKVLQLVLVLFLVKENSDYVKYAMILFGLSGLSNVFNIIYLRKFVVPVSRSLIDIKRHFRFVITLSSSSLVTAISSQFDVTMLGSLSGTVYVGYYTAGMKAVKLFLQLFMSLFSVLIPRIEYYKKNNSDKYSNLVDITCKGVMILIIPISMGMFRFSEDIVLFFAGEQFRNSILLLKIISCFLLVDMISYILVSCFMFPNRNEDKYAICIVVAAFVNIGLNIILIPVFYHIGAVIATIISNVVCLVIQYFFSKKYFNVSLIFNKETLKYFISGIIMLLILFLIPFNFKYNMLNIILGTCIGAFVYAILLIILKSDLIFLLLSKIKKRIL
jgi:O-antigen/teichoic acid export membrane protein